MKCEWCAHGKEALWWIRSKIGLWSWGCEACRDRVCDRDETGAFVAIPAAEKLALMEKEKQGH